MRALLIVLDSVGVGNAPDAGHYGDAGANTLGHIFEQRPELRLPVLDSLGLGDILGRPDAVKARAGHGRMQSQSSGKDTTTGHWEIAGVVLRTPFAIFERFPEELVRKIEREAGVTFIGNYARSGTAILEELGAEHLRTGKPILYTSADSVLQIAAHEQILPIKQLYEICEVARKHANNARIGRVIARPFDGVAGSFRRTPRRHDYSMKPPHTVLNAISGQGHEVIGIGKIHDIFAGEGVTRSYSTGSNRGGMDRIAELWATTQDGLIFANLVDFDMLYGHRRDVSGYAGALEEFDSWLGDFRSTIRPEDLVIITADHGNDPTFRGSDHTREQVPLFVLHQNASDDLGTRETFADIAATLVAYFQLPEAWMIGKSFLPQ